MSLVSMMSYPFGTLVWVKVVNRYWWPGIVVDPQTIPEDLLEYVNKVNHIAVVHYEYENKYEVVIKHNNICLYSGPHKMDYIEKGLNLYINQKKGIPTVGKFDMEAFKEDILSMEKRIGGDVNIFETIKKNQEEIKLLINSHFTPSKTKNRKKEKVVKEAVKVVRKSQGKSLPSRKSLPTKTNESPSIPQPKQNRAIKRKSSPPSKVVKLHTPIRTAVTNGYTCHVHVNCTFTTYRYDILKRHMAMCKNDLKEETVKKSPNAKKRKNIKNKSSEAKKIKLQEELLKDWDNDGEDDDVQFNISNVQSTSGVAPTIAKVKPTTSEVLSINSQSIPTKISEVLPTTTSEVLPTTTSEVLPTTTSEDLPNTTSEIVHTTSEVLPTISNEIQETNTTVVEQRQSKSDCSSTVNVINDKLELQLSSDIKNIHFETAQNESLLVEKIQDPSNGPREIDDQNSTELLLEKTVNTLDQINNFENSLSDISNTLNKSDSNILTKDNNIIGVPELSGIDSLKKPTSPSKEVHTEIANSIDIVEKVENKADNPSIQMENHKLVGEKTNDAVIVPNDVEVNQPNDTTIDKDMPIENSCSVNNISNKMDSEDKITAEKDNVRCILDIAKEPDWVKDNDWRSDENNQLKKVRLWTSYVDYQHYVPKPENNKPTYNYNSIEVEFSSDKINGSRESFKIDLKKVLLPYAQTPMEELRANANVRALQEAAMNGAVLEIVLKHPHVM